MVFREETVLQVRSMVAEMEKPLQKAPPADSDLIKGRSSSGDSRTGKESTSKLPKGRHAKSCLANNLFHSVYKGRMKKVKFLLDNGMSLNNKNEYGYSVLVAALHIENDTARSKMFRFLLDNDADPLQRDRKYGRSVLSWAAVMGRKEQVNLLLDCYMGDFDFHEKDRDGMTALHLATQSGHSEIVLPLVTEMVRFGTSVDVTDNLGLTPYLHAKRLGYGYIADILREEGNACVGQGDTFSFKRAEEWRDIGIRERNEKARLRRDSQYEQAAISGSARMLQMFDHPGYEVIDFNSDAHRRKEKAAKDSAKDNTTSKSVRIMSPRSEYSLPEPLSKAQRNSVSDPRAVLSLIQMSPSVKGQVPKHFRQSQIDTTKASHYKHILTDLASMMDYLSDKHTKSFREGVPPPKLRHLADKEKDKKSTLAIIFGKKRGKKAAREHGTCSKKGSGRQRRGSKSSR